MEAAPKGMRLHIGIFGRCNVGKSSLLNAITRQQVSIVSEVAGTTTDPVEKPMELLPLGPVLFIDTAGIDDSGALGEKRLQKTRIVLDRTDLAVLVALAKGWGAYEEKILKELTARKAPVVVVFNKVDLEEPDPALLEALRSQKLTVLQTVACDSTGILELREALLKTAPADFIEGRSILSDLVGAGELAVLVVPIDKEAPKGRLIFPQVQSIRELLDVNAMCMVVKEHELRAALAGLKRPPKLVVTDSQAFLKVVADTPKTTLMTSFSILFSRFKGDLAEQVKGAMAVERLVPGDRVLIAEACCHHPIGEDIGRVKIPHWLNQYVGGPLKFTNIQGHDFPADLSAYKLVVHCGACMWNRREMLGRIVKCQQAGVPITNYGLVIAYSLGIFERALGPFPAALEIWRNHPRRRKSVESKKHASMPSVLSRSIESWLRETRTEELDKLYRAADQARQTHVGDAVHLRGLIEISNHCSRQCGYCGLRAGNKSLERYRMTGEEIMACVEEAVHLNYGTVVLQSGEDFALSREWIAGLVRKIKAQTSLAVTLSLGERSHDDLEFWRLAGADRYLLRFETSDRELFRQIHPARSDRESDRIEILKTLARLGFEVGSGVMVGIPGQSYQSLAEDVLTFQRLDLDMIGIGPYIAHPGTPLGRGEYRSPIPAEDQVPNSEEMVYKMIALTRLVCPTANLPATSALATVNRKNGREIGLSRGANVIMPNVTPVKYRKLYEIYPNKACVQETAAQCQECLGNRIFALGRVVGQGKGGRERDGV